MAAIRSVVAGGRVAGLGLESHALRWGIYAVAASVLTGSLIVVLPPAVSLLGAVALMITAAVCLRPAVAGYLLVGVTPLIAGIDRGTLIPVLRPNEALALLLAGALLLRGLVRSARGDLPQIRVTRAELSIVLMAFASLVLPLAWMLIRGQEIAQDDVFYALMLTKFLGVYVIVRASVRSEQQVHRCLCVAMAAACVVSLIAILQSLQLFGVPRMLSTYYVSFGNTEPLYNSRGSSTLALPVAVADLMTFNLGIAIGLLVHRAAAHRGVVLSASLLFVLGVVASGQFSGLIGLCLAAVAIAWILRRPTMLVALVPTVLIAGAALRPVIERRVSAFSSATGLPVSWIGRVRNLRTYFWPELFSNYNFLLGVRPAARIATTTMATGYVWIESGYTWLLWSGGIPFLLSFLYFLWTNMRMTAKVARRRTDAVGVAALAGFAALMLVAVLMTIDPHLTYRGSGDLLFSLLALASAGSARDSEREEKKKQGATTQS